MVTRWSRRENSVTVDMQRTVMIPAVMLTKTVTHNPILHAHSNRQLNAGEGTVS